jgi:hypothetical protein
VIAITELLERAIAQLKTLPSNEQDSLAAILLADMESERIWKDKFESTTDDQWQCMADMVRQEISNSNVTLIAEL